MLCQRQAEEQHPRHCTSLFYRVSLTQTIPESALSPQQQPQHSSTPQSNHVKEMPSIATPIPVHFGPNAPMLSLPHDSRLSSFGMHTISPMASPALMGDRPSLLINTPTNFGLSMKSPAISLNPLQAVTPDSSMSDFRLSSEVTLPALNTVEFSGLTDGLTMDNTFEMLGTLEWPVTPGSQLGKRSREPLL